MGNISLKRDDVASGLYTQSNRVKYIDHKREILDVEIQSSRISSSKVLEIEELKVFENYKLVHDVIEDYKNDITYFYQDSEFIDKKIVINNSFKTCVKHKIEKRYNTKIEFKYKITKVGEINLNLFDIFSGYKFDLKLKTIEETKNKFFNISIESKRDKVIITLTSDTGTSLSYIFSIKDKRFINLTDNSLIQQKDVFNLNINDFNILDLNVEDINYISKDDIKSYMNNKVKLLFFFDSEIENYIHIQNFEYKLNDIQILNNQDLDSQLKTIVENNISLKEMNFLINRTLSLSFQFDTWIYMRIKPYLHDLNDELIFHIKSPEQLSNILIGFNGHTDFKYLFNENSESLDLMINPSWGIVYYKSSRYDIGDLTVNPLNDRWLLYQSTNLTEIMLDLNIEDLTV